MKKKHKLEKGSSTPGSSAVSDLKSLIDEHSLFFDNLIKLIPAKFYLPADDQERPWYQGLSNAAKASAKKEARENIKKARRERLDPDSSKTTLDLLNESLEEKFDKAKDESDKVGKALPPGSGSEAEEHSMTYEELRQRLRRRIEELRGGRTAKPGNEEKMHEKKQPRENKRKRESTFREEDPGKDDSEKVKDIAEATKDITFSHVKLGNEESKRRKKKHSKVSELEKARQLEEAKKDPNKGEQISKKHSWKAAADRAAGVKVHDDPRLLNKSLQKEKRRREKNAEKWKERVESTQKTKAEKQKKRADNIAGRIHDKKMRKISKREKKLMRPGFEGRKDGYINENEP